MTAATERAVDRAAGIGVPLAAVGAVGLAIWLGVTVLKPILDAAGSASKALAATAGNLGKVAETVTATAADAADFAFLRRPDLPSSEYKATRPTMKLEVVKHDENNSNVLIKNLPWVRAAVGAGNWNRVTLRVTANGRPVVGAKVTGVTVGPVFPSPNLTQTTGADGQVTMEYRLPQGVGETDDVKFKAVHPNNNDSNEVRVG